MKKFLFGVNSIQGLECLKIAKKFEEEGKLEIVGVMAKSGEKWYDLYGWDCQKYARENGIEIIDSIEDTEHDVFISILYDKILKKDEIERARLYCLNFHIADATKYRGCYPLYHAIMNGEKEYGVTCHRITGEIDAGDIYKIVRFPIAEDDTAFSLNLKTVKFVKKLFTEVVEKIVNNICLTFTKNNNSAYYSRDSLFIPEEISWDAVRALFFPPFLPFHTYVDGHKVLCIPENAWKYLKMEVKL